MTTRQEYRATLQLAGGEELARDKAYAHNSGVRRSEALARSYAREHGVMLHGDKPVRDEHGYARTWRTVDGGHIVFATVVKLGG